MPLPTVRQPPILKKPMAAKQAGTYAVFELIMEIKINFVEL